MIANSAGGVAVAGRSKALPWMIGGGIAGVIALALVGLTAAGILRFGAKEPESEVLRAQGQTAPPDLLRARGQEAGPGIAQIPQPERVRMPDDVRAWLEHLERIEKEKNTLHRRQAIRLQASMTNIAARVSSAGVESMINEDAPETPQLDLSDLIPVDTMLGEWEALRTKLNSVRPPPECMPLYESYHGAFVNLQQEIGKLREITKDLYGIFQRGGQEQAVKQAEGVGSGHGRGVDDLLVKSDEQLLDICEKFNERKWFAIKSDLGGSMMQFGL